MAKDRNEMKLKNKTIIITGASRGIGRAIALKCARDGANIVIASKTTEKHPKLEGSIYTVAEEVEAAGGNVLPIQVDVRDEAQIEVMVSKTVEKFGGVDVLINNAGAIHLASLETTPMKRYDLVQSVNARAVFLCAQKTLPYLKKSKNAHILNMSPPINFETKWLKQNLAYMISKYGMTICTIGLSSELNQYGIAVNSLWPRTSIATAAIQVHFGEEMMKQSRTPEIMAEAAYEMITTTGCQLTGKTLFDEDVLRDRGRTDFSKYAVDPTKELLIFS